MSTQEEASRANRAYYEHKGAGTDDYWRKMAAPRFRVATLLGLLGEGPPPVELVDAGCGGGQLLAEIAARFPGTRLCGVDLAEALIAENRRTWPGLRWEVADLGLPGAVPPVLRGRFDVVTAAEIVEHVEDPLIFLQNARDLATPGTGRLLLSTQSGPLRETERRVGHRRHFTAREMDGLLRRAGWRPARVWNCGFPFHDLSKWYANLRPDATMAQFGERAYGWKEELVCLGLRQLFRLNSRRRGAQLFAVAQAP